MATATYTAGAWLGVVRSNTAVLLGPGTPPALIQSLWELLADAPEVHEVLHAVTSSFGVSLAQIPSFGIVDFRESLRVFLRGDLDLTVQLPGSELELNGRDVTTWTERRLDAPQWYRLTVAGDPQSGPALPLREGVILLESLTVALAGAPAATASPAAGAVSPMAASAEAEAPAVTDAVVLVPESVPIAAIAPTPDTEPDLETAPDPQTAPEPGTESDAEAESEPEAELEPEPEPETEPQTEPETEPQRRADREVSAETVMGVLDDDEPYGGEAADTPEPAASVEPASHADQVPAHELTGTYDHLWEKTVVRSIEDAAVRDEPEEAEPAAGPATSPEAGDAPAASSASEPHAAEDAAALAPAPPAPELAGPPLPPPTRQPAPTGPGGLIDSVPWRTGGGSAPAAQVPPSFGLPPAAPASVPSSVAPTSGPVPASVSAVPPVPSAPEAGQDGFDGDHDGHTIMKSDLAGMSAHPAPLQDPEAAAGPLVLARVCGHGHANPPTHSQCAACGSPLPADAVQVARPRLGRMRVSTGELVDLDQSLVIGRQPSVSRVQGGVMPRLVQVASPSGDISRSHVEVRLEGWHVMLCDLKATNGTVLVREGQQPRRLAQNEMAILLDGDIAELGDDISLRFEEIL